MGIFSRKIKIDDEDPAPTAAAGGLPIAENLPNIEVNMTAPVIPPPIIPPPIFQAPIATKPAPPIPQAPAHAPAPAANRTGYGIDDAVRLMRSLPMDRNVDLVVRVVKQTLESLHITVADIVVDAERKETSIREEVAAHKSDISVLERELQSLRAEINRLQTDLAEISTVKQRLRLAEGKQDGTAPLTETNDKHPAAEASKADTMGVVVKPAG